MLYISEEKRKTLDNEIEKVREALVDFQFDDEETNIEACIQYIIMRLLSMIYGNKEGTTDANIIDVLGILEGVKLEFFRKAAVPHNDQQEFDHGEINPHGSHPTEVVGQVTITPDDLGKEDLEVGLKVLNILQEKHGKFGGDVLTESALERAAALTKSRLERLTQILESKDK